MRAVMSTVPPAGNVTMKRILHVPMLPVMLLRTHLLYFDREVRRLENLANFDRVTGFGRATLRPFQDFFF